MKATKEYTSSIIELISKSRKYNNNLGRYVEHFINESSNYSVKLNNDMSVVISRIVVKDFNNQPSSLEEIDLIEIADSALRLDKK